MTTDMNSSPAPAQRTAAPAGSASASLYVGDLHPEVNEALLFEIFNTVGPVASIRVCRDHATRRSLGYAYVNFHRVQDAEHALDTKNFSVIRGQRCRIMWSNRDPSLRKSGKGNIFVKNLAKHIDNESLFDTFSVFGNLLSCKVASAKTVNGLKGESLGYGFVHFENEADAQTAIDKVDGKSIGGQVVSVAHFKSKSERTGGKGLTFTNCYIKNLPTENFDEKELMSEFEKCGKVSSVMLARDKETNALKGFAFVNFESSEGALKAVELYNGQDFKDSGKKLFVGPAQKKEQRIAMLSNQFEKMKMERAKKYAGANLYVKNLSDDIDDAKLRELFTPFGAITSTKVVMDNGKSRGFGFVCFSVPEEATKAVTEMNGKMVNNKPLYVALAQRKEDRRAKLAAQHAARNKQAMFQQGAPMFYAPHQGMHLRYPQPMMMMPRPMGAMGHPGAPGMNFVMQPQRGRGRGAMQRGRGRGQMQGRGRGRMNRGRGNGKQQQGYKFNQNVRNNRQDQIPSVPVPMPVPIPSAEGQALSLQQLASASPDKQREMIGERLFPLIQARQPTLAGKITGMLLEMDNGELLHLLETPAALDEKVKEATAVLADAGAAGEAEEVAAEE